MSTWQCAVVKQCGKEINLHYFKALGCGVVFYGSITHTLVTTTDTQLG